MTIKRCYECLAEKPLIDFPANSRLKDGRFNKCKACTKIYAQKHRAANIEHLREYDKNRANRPGRPESVRRLVKKWKAANPKRMAAHKAVSNEIKQGRIVRQPCMVCGKQNAHGHHPDYDRPLDVVWLCPLHHKEAHKNT